MPVDVYEVGDLFAEDACPFVKYRSLIRNEKGADIAALPTALAAHVAAS
jgi:hypothetical protein